MRARKAAGLVLAAVLPAVVVAIHPTVVAASDETGLGAGTGCDPSESVTWHADNDRDGYGDDDGSPWPAVTDCNKPAATLDPFDDVPAEWVTNNSDCDDTDDAVHPGASDIPHDGVDQDCSGGDELDADGDGADGPSGSGPDCDDDDDSIGPAADDIPYDGIDQDCDGEDLRDVDGDGYPGTLAGGPDCNDQDAAIHPNAIDEPGDGIDLDCDGDDGLLDSDDGGCGCRVSQPQSMLTTLLAGLSLLMVGRPRRRTR